MSVTPITPQEARKRTLSGSKEIPDFVIEVVNQMLSQPSGQPKRNITIFQNVLINRILAHSDCPKGITSRDILKNHWLEFESLYREADWDVKYDSIGEDFEYFFTFTPMKPDEK